jgi:hypothetical protein
MASMPGLNSMWFTVLLFVSLDRAELTISHPGIALNAPVVVGKPDTPTPPGIYLITRGYSEQLDMPILIFRREDRAVWAAHPNLPSRTKQIRSPTSTDNYLSGGCIGVEPEIFDKLWAIKQAMVLQVY